MKSKKIASCVLASILALGSAVLPNGAWLGKTQLSANAESIGKYEAENAVLSGVTVHSGSDYSGGKYVKFESSGSCTFNVTVSQTGIYDINIYTYGFCGDKVNFCYVDGEKLGEFSTSDKVYANSTVANVGLTAGTHEISVKPSWGWIYLDYIELSTAEGLDKDTYNVSKTLINENASESARRLYSYLCDTYGESIITGQQCDGGINGSEFQAVKNVTGKTPAILGLDLMNYSPSRVALGDKGSSIEKAVEFSKNGGIVTFCWHWNAPTKYLKSGTDNGNPRWWGGFYTKNIDTSSMNLENMLSGTDKEGHKFLIDEIDAIAYELKKLQDADVPVLFRPLHEASGGWFWWGAYGSDAYKKLWNFMYDRITNVHGLNNLIWVWNGQDPSWYPGDDCVDIIGEDIYPGNKVYNPQSSKFAEIAKYSNGSKIIAMSENGCLFDIDKAFVNDTKWAWFCTWSGEFSAVSEQYTEKDMWKKVYQNDKAVTLENLPDLRSYPLDDTKISIETASIEINDQTFDFTGSEIKPVVTVKKDGKTLENGKDYTVSYEDNINPGSGKVVVSGIGNYTGAVVKYFLIRDVETKITDIADCTITLSQNTYEYTGAANKPKVTVKAGSKVLTLGTDYAVRYIDNVEIGTASVKIAGKGEYTGSRILNFTIKEPSVKLISQCSISLNKTAFNYTGSAVKPKVTVRDGSRGLILGSDYAVRYVNNVNAGTASVVISGKGSYTGSVTKYFTIMSNGTIDLTKCTVSLSKDSLKYTGNAVKPKVTVKYGDKLLTLNTDYAVRYVNNVNVGTAAVVVSGKGDYKGTISKTFTITK